MPSRERERPAMSRVKGSRELGSVSTASQGAELRSLTIACRASSSCTQMYLVVLASSRSRSISSLYLRKKGGRYSKGTEVSTARRSPSTAARCQASPGGGRRYVG